MEPRRNSPHATPPGRSAYASPARTARVTSNTPGRVDGAPPRPPSGGEGARKQDGNGVTLPLITPPGHGPSMRGSSPGSSKRLGWTTPRSPTEESREVRPPSSTTDRPSRYEPTDEHDHDVRFWNDGTPALPLGMPDDDRGDVREPDPTDVNQAAQLAYMERMYTTIQQLNAELDRERADAKRRAASIESHVENREHATLDVLHRIGTEVEESENFGVVGAQIPIGGAGVSSAATVNKRCRPHQPRPTALPDPKAALAKEQLELCAALGKNAELRIRNREIEKQSESSSQVLEQTQRQMKMAERRIANREEKLRGLLKEKLRWQNEMKDLREQVVEEKMRQVDLLRRLETTKREAIAQVDAMAQMLRDVEEENQVLRVHLVETKNQLASQTKKLEDVVRQSRDEKEKLVECINEARSKFKEWKDGEANVLRAQKDQAVNNLKAEYELKIARHQEEKQKLRDKVKDLEVSVRLMQKDRSLSPLELSLRKAAILGGRDSAGTTEGEVIEANVRVKELEAMLEHTAEYQKRQENIIKVSEATISRLLQEREVAALDGLASQPLLGSNGLVNSSAAPPDSSYFPFGAVSPVRGTFGGSSTLSPRQLHTVTRPPPRALQVPSEQPVVRPVAPPPRVAAPPVRRNSGDRVTKVTAKETEESLRQVHAEPKQAGPSPRELLLVQEVDRLQKELAEAKKAFLREEKIRQQDAASVSRTDNSSTDQILGPDNCEMGTGISISGPDGGNQSRADFTDVPDNGVAACHTPEVSEAVPVIGSSQTSVGDPNTLSSEDAQYIPTQASASPSVERCNGDGDHDTPEHVAPTEDRGVLPEDRVDRNTADAGLPSLGEAREEEASHFDVLSNGAPSDANTTINDTDPASGVDRIYESSQDVLEKDATRACTRNGEHKNDTLSETCTYDGHSSSQSIEPPTEPATDLGEQEKSNREAVSLVAEHFVQDVVLTHAITSVASLVMECTTPIEVSCVGRRPSFDSHREAQLTEEVTEEIASVLVAQITDTEFEESSPSNPDLLDSPPTYRDSVSEEGGPSSTATTELGICGARVGDEEMGFEGVQREPADMSNVSTETASLVDDSDVVGLPEPSNESKVLIKATQIAMASFVSAATAQAAGVVIAMSSYSKPVMPAGNECEPIMLRDHDHVCDLAPLAAETVCEARQTTDMSELLAARTFINAITQHALDTLIAVAATTVHSEPQAQVSDTQMSSVARTGATSQPFEVAESATSAESKVDAIAVGEAVMEPDAKELVSAKVEVPADGFTEAEVNAAVEESVEALFDAAVLATMVEAESRLKTVVDALQGVGIPAAEGESTVEASVDVFVAQPIHAPIAGAETPAERLVAEALEVAVDIVVGSSVEAAVDIPVSIEAPVGAQVEFSEQCAAEAIIEEAVDTSMVEAVPMETPVNAALDTLAEALVVGYVKAALESSVDAVVRTAVISPIEAPEDAPVGVTAESPVETLIDEQMPAAATPLVEASEEASEEARFEPHADTTAEVPAELSVKANNAEAAACAEDRVTEAVDPPEEASLITPEETATGSLETTAPEADVSVEAVEADVEMSDEAGAELAAVNLPPEGPAEPVSAPEEVTAESTIGAPVELSDVVTVVNAVIPAEVPIRTTVEVDEVPAGSIVEVSYVEAPVGVPVDELVEAAVEALVAKVELSVDTSVAVETLDKEEVEVPLVEENTPVDMPMEELVDSVLETLVDAPGDAAIESSVESASDTSIDAKVAEVEMPVEVRVEETVAESVESPMTDVDALVEAPEGGAVDIAFVEVEESTESSVKAPVEPAVEATRVEAELPVEESVEASLVALVETVVSEGEKRDVSVEAGVEGTVVDKSVETSIGATINEPVEAAIEAPVIATVETLLVEVEKYVDTQEVAPTGEVGETEPLDEALVVAAVEHSLEASTDTPFESAVDSLHSEDVSADTAVEAPFEVGAEAAEEVAVDAPAIVAVDGAGDTMKTAVDVVAEAPVEATVDTAVDATIDAAVEVAVAAVVEAAVEVTIEASLVEVAGEAKVEVPAGALSEVVVEDPPELAEEVKTAAEAPVEISAEAEPASFGNVASGETGVETQAEAHVEASVVAAIETALVDEDVSVEMPVEVSVDIPVDGPVRELAEDAVGSSTTVSKEVQLETPIEAPSAETMMALEEHSSAPLESLTEEQAVATDTHVEAAVCAVVEALVEASIARPAVPLAVEIETLLNEPVEEAVSTLLDESKEPVETKSPVDAPVEASVEALVEMVVAKAERSVELSAGAGVESLVEVATRASVETPVQTPVDVFADASVAVKVILAPEVEATAVAAADAREGVDTAPVDVSASNGEGAAVEKAVDAARLSIEAVEAEIVENVSASVEAVVEVVVSESVDPAVESLVSSGSGVLSGETAVGQCSAVVEAVDEPTVMVCREPSIVDMRFDSAGIRPPSARPSSSCSTRTDSYGGDIAPLNLNPDLWPQLDLTLSAPAPTPDPSRYASGLIREMIRDPTLMAYDVKHEQERPFELMDEKILTIDQQARHMHFDENDRVGGSDPNVSPPLGTPSTEDGVLVTKKKRTGYDEKRKSIAYRLIPAFNYEPVLIKFQWSDFVVATPIRNLSSASQLNLLVKTGDVEGAAITVDNPAKVTALLTCPVQKMTLLLKKGIRLPCGTYVIVSVFKRPLEDGNENLRVLIYDSERVEEFQYDFHEEHLRDYMEEWHATSDEARAFMTRLEFRREQGMVIIKMPERIRESSVIYIDDRPSSSSSNTTTPLTYFQIHQHPPPLIPKFSLDSLIHATELPPEPQYRISPRAPILPPGTRRMPVDERTSENE